MPSAEFFNKFGFFSVKNFLDEEFYGSLCEEMREAPQELGNLSTAFTYENTTNEDFSRRREITKLSSNKLETINDKLIAIIPEIEENFKTEINGLQPLRPSVYKKGDFFKPHSDKKPDPNSPDFMKERKVSIIIFLNEESPIEKEGTYSGGNLTFYGLIEKEGFENMGLPLVAEPGLLIAFPPERTHQVTEVTTGERYVIVGFYK